MIQQAQNLINEGKIKEFMLFMNLLSLDDYVTVSLAIEL